MTRPADVSRLQWFAWGIQDARSEVMGRLYECGFPPILLTDMADFADLAEGIAYDHKTPFCAMMARWPVGTLQELNRACSDWLA